MPRYSRKFKVNTGTQTDDGRVERSRPSYLRILAKRRLAEALEAVAQLEEADNQNVISLQEVQEVQEEQEQAIDLTEDSQEVSGNTNNPGVGVNSYIIICLLMIATILTAILIASWKT